MKFVGPMCLIVLFSLVSLCIVIRACRGRRIRLKSGIPLINKVLVAVDFDHTLIDTNSDTYIQKLAPNGKFPTEMRERYVPGEYLKYYLLLILFSIIPSLLRNRFCNVRPV